MIAIIPAAGLGTRMGELTRGFPKPLLPLWGKPMLAHIITQLKEAGVHEIVCVVGYQKERIMEYFQNGEAFGVALKYVVQDEPRGTADALRCAKPHISADAFFLQWSDILVPASWYRRLCELHARCRSGVVTVDRGGDYGAGAGVKIASDFIPRFARDDLELVCGESVEPVEGVAVTDIVEKPIPSEGVFEWNNSGIFLLRKEILAFLSPDASQGGETPFTATLRTFVKSGGPLYAAEIPRHHYFDFKNREIYERYLVERVPDFLS